MTITCTLYTDDSETISFADGCDLVNARAAAIQVAAHMSSLTNGLSEAENAANILDEIDRGDILVAFYSEA